MQQQDEQGLRGTPEPTPPPERTASGASGLTALAPFRIRAFRYQWPSDLMTAVAVEMEVVILGWYVLNETGSVLLLTLYGALHFFGTLSAPLIGVAGDRMGLRPLLVLMRSTYVIITAILAMLALTGQMSPYVVFVLATLIALVRPSDISVRTAIVASLMPPALLTGAVGLSRSTGDVARIFGALAGSTLFALFGMGPAYVAILALYFAGMVLTMVAGAFATRAPATVNAGATRRSPGRELRAGLSYVWQTPHLQAGMWLAVLANLTAFPLTSGLMPYIARNVYSLDKAGLGLLIASFATGALLGSLTVGAIGSRLLLGRQMLVASVAWHLMLLGFVHAPGPTVGAAFLVLAGFAQSISMVSLAAMLLRTSAPEFHGRIMGVRMLSTYSLPVGLVILGALVERLGFAVTASLWLLSGIALTAAIALNWRAAVWLPAAPANAR